MPGHAYLHLDDHHLTHADAVEAVVRVAEACGVPLPPTARQQWALAWQASDGQQQHWSFADLVAETERTGVVPELQEIGRAHV